MRSGFLQEQAGSLPPRIPLSPGLGSSRLLPAGSQQGEHLLAMAATHWQGALLLHSSKSSLILQPSWQGSGLVSFLSALERSFREPANAGQNCQGLQRAGAPGRPLGSPALGFLQRGRLQGQTLHPPSQPSALKLLFKKMHGFLFGFIPRFRFCSLLTYCKPSQ